MSVLKVIEHLKKYNMEDEIITMNGSSATVLLAANELGCNPEDIAKTMGFIVDDKAIVIVMAGDRKIDNSKYKSVFHQKAKMIPCEEVEEITGHPVGGVCPFGLNDGVDVYLDISLKKFDFVYPACGEANNAIKISIPDLEKVTNFVSYVDVTK